MIDFDLIVLILQIGLLAFLLYLSSVFSSSETALFSLKRHQLAAFARSAQFLLHTWLPYTMEGPTPVSALMHAGIVNAGGFLINRFAPVFVQTEGVLLLAFAIGLRAKRVSKLYNGSLECSLAHFRLTGEDRERLAKEVAGRADLVIFVLDGDITDTDAANASPAEPHPAVAGTAFTVDWTVRNGTTLSVTDTRFESNEVPTTGGEREGGNPEDHGQRRDRSGHGGSRGTSGRDDRTGGRGLSPGKDRP